MSQSNAGPAFMGVIFALLIGYVVVSFISTYWPILVAILGVLIILYAYFLGSLWGRRRLKWRLRFGIFGSVVALIGLGAMQPLNETAAVGVVVSLALIHGASWVIMWLADMLFQFIYEDRIERQKAETDARAKAQRDQEARQHQEQQRRQEEAKKRPREEFAGSVQSEKQALELFELSQPFTLEQLNKRRLDLLKKVHPDQGGSNMMARLVNEAYELLKVRV